MASQLTASPTFFSTPVAVQIETGEPILRVGIAEIAGGVAEQVERHRPGWRKRHRRNAVEIILAERDESFGHIFGDRARRADIGLLVGDLLEVDEGLGVVLRHVAAHGAKRARA